MIGWSEHCIATHPSDFCVPLAALDAAVEIAGAQGGGTSRWKTFTCFRVITRKGKCPQAGELVVAVRIPAPRHAFPLSAGISSCANAHPMPLPWFQPP